MFIDADHLKYINDTFGHDMGNLEIRGIADGIRKVFPPEAVSMRYGGDEFVVLLPGCEKTQAESLKAAFLKALDEISKSLKKRGKHSANKCCFWEPDVRFPFFLK